MIQRNVHHQAKTPTWTCQVAPVFNERASKWSCRFETWRGIPGAEYLATSCTTGALFLTEDEAYSAGERALDVLEETDRFPNMCEKF